MSDLISKSNLIEELNKAPAYFDSGDVRYGIQIAISVVENQPPIEAKPVFCGEWICQNEARTRFMCSQCKAKNYGGHENFCPNCGCDMRKKVEHGKID